MALHANSLADMFAERVSQSATRQALHFKRNGTFTSVSWNELADQVAAVALWLEVKGIGKADTVASFAPNRWQWIVFDLAIYVVGGIHVPIHAPLSGEQAAFQISDSGAKALAVDGETELRKLGPFELGIPILTFADRGPSSQDDHSGPFKSRETLTAWNELQATLWAGNVASIDSSDVATILYTSGTTGEPKGVVLTHGNLRSNTTATLLSVQQTPDDLRLGFLPLSHIFARTCDLYTWIEGGSQFALAESRDSVLSDCQTLRPQILNGVPYFFDRVRRHLIDRKCELTENSLRDLFGGEIRFCCSGGAALPDYLFDFYQENGVPILQGYGLTETSPVVTFSNMQNVRRGSVGLPLPEVDVRIALDGEVLTRGPHVMQGYFQKPQDTQDVIQDGWFHTGDLGRVDEDGYLYITGRKKELIVTSAGKNVAPVFLESLLTEDPLISQAVVIGDDERFLTALIVADEAVLSEQLGLAAPLDMSDERIRSHIQSAIDRRLAVVSYYEQVRRFHLVLEPFSVENRMLTPKLSLRRSVICAVYTEYIDAMYGRRSQTEG